MAVHVVSPEEESQQQKLDLLWWKLDEQAPLAQVGRHGGATLGESLGVVNGDVQQVQSWEKAGSGEQRGTGVPRGWAREGGTKPDGKRLGVRPEFSSLRVYCWRIASWLSPCCPPDRSTWCVAQ